MNGSRDVRLSLGTRLALGGALLVALAWAAAAWLWIEDARERRASRPDVESARLAAGVEARLAIAAAATLPEVDAAVRAARVAVRAGAEAAIERLSERQRRRFERQRTAQVRAAEVEQALRRQLEASDLDGAWIRRTGEPPTWSHRGAPDAAGAVPLDGACIAPVPGRDRGLARCREVAVETSAGATLLAGGLRRIAPPEIDGAWAVALDGEDHPWAQGRGWTGLVPPLGGGQASHLGEATTHLAVVEGRGPVRLRVEPLAGLPARVAVAVPRVEPLTLEQLARGDAAELTAEWRDWLVRSGVVAAAALAISCLLGWRLRRALAPLVAAAERVGGDAPLPRGLPLSRRDEIGAVAARLAELGGSLRATRRALARQLEAAAWRDVARSLAHELKNPLLPLRGTLENLQRWRVEDPARFEERVGSRLETMAGEVERLQRLIGALSRLSHLPEPRPRDVPGPELAELVRRQLELRRDAAADVAFEEEIHVPLPAVRVDPDQLGQVVANLLQNAVEAFGTRKTPGPAGAGATPGAGGTVRVAAGAEGDGAVTLTVSDDGPGVADGELERIFLPGHTTKGASGGQGLGLFLCRRMIAEQGGSLEATHGPSGKGLSVVLRLPVASRA